MTSPIKWLGGKRFQLEQIIPKIMVALESSQFYIEPFLGGGSVLIELLKRCENTNITFLVSDINDILIRMYKEIQTEPRKLMDKLDELYSRMSTEDYYEIRKEFNKHQTVEQFIYLNKRCFRGLYRVNRKGEFNSSCSSEKNVVLYDENNILELNKLFNKFNVVFETKDYLDIEILPNSVIYFDPPYYGMFNEYSMNSFDHIQYVDVLNYATSLPDVALFHSNSTLLKNIYKGVNYFEIQVRDRINAKNPSDTRIELFYYS
jgi:DNA adenine methylase